MRQNTGFRDDINGLRAWAVLAVVLFHFGAPGFSGGFVGVDVFFVISGYLMTRIIVTGLERGQFSYLGFCMARAARILPALLALCTVLLTLGYFTLTPIDYRTLASHALSSAGFFSNFKYWDEAGYFDSASHEKWLLHTWSLSVEWQFYLLLPLLFMAIWVRLPSRAALLVTTLVVLAGSLAFSIWATPAHPSLSFFLLPSRIWQMLLGGLVFLWVEPLALKATWSAARGQSLAVLGLCFIGISVTLFGPSSPWPGWRSALPTLGAALVIAGANTSSWLTNNRCLRWAGERSYSIYLWHWPIYVASRYLGLSEQAATLVTMGALTAVFAELSYRLVELPCRQRLGRKPLSVSIGAVTAATLAVAAAAVVVRLQDGFVGRLPVQVEQAANESENWNPKRKACHTYLGLDTPSCTWGGDASKPPSVALAGDSHAFILLTAVAHALPQAAGPAVGWTYSGCQFLLGSAPSPEHQARLGKHYRCAEFQQSWKARIDALADNVPVIISNRYAAALYGDGGDKTRFLGSALAFDGIRPTTEQASIDAYSRAIVRTACAFRPQRRVILIRPIPEMPSDVPRAVARRLMMGAIPEVTVTRRLYELRNGWVWKAQDAAVSACGVEVLDPTRALCDSTQCFGYRHGQVLYHDDDHLSETGIKLLVEMFRTVLPQHEN